MLFTLVTPLMALIAAVHANVVTIHDSVTIIEDITETVTVTNCGTKSCHPASQVNITSGGQTVVRCPIGEIVTGIYPPPTVVHEPLTETSTVSERAYASSHKHHRSKSSSLVSVVSFASSTSGFSPPFVHTETTTTSNSAKPSKSHSFSQIASSMVSVSSPPCASTTTRIASYPSSFVSDNTSSTTALSASLVPVSSASSVKPTYNTSAGTYTSSHFSDIPCPDKTRFASTATLCVGCSTQESPVSETNTNTASTVIGASSYTAIYSSDIKSNSVSQQCIKCIEASPISSAPRTTISAEVSSAFTSISYNASSVIASNSSQLTSCTTCSIEAGSITSSFITISNEASSIPSFSQGSVSSESNQEATAYVDVTATRYLNSSTGTFYSATPKASSGVATNFLSQSIFPNRSNSSVSTLASVTPYQGSASSMKAAGFGAILGAALIAIM